MAGAGAARPHLQADAGVEPVFVRATGSLDAGGVLSAVQWGSPAFDAGIISGAIIVATNGEAYDGDRLKEAIKAAAKPGASLVDELRADGLIIHVNPLQEWFQPEGDLLEVSPLETITRFVENAPYPVMVKEVGHGMGPESLKALMRLPLAAIEFGAYGGTNFSILESRRAPGAKPEGLVHVGHTAQEMVSFVKDILTTKEKFRCENFIISGGLQNSLQGYHLTSQLPGMALFGMANSVLREAQHGEVALREFLQKEISQFAMAQAYLRPAGDQT